jgi:sterol 14-demethylase
VGSAFAMMQLKAIFSILLQRYDFELAQPRESYGNDYSKMVVAVRQPCGVRYRRRERAAPATASGPRAAEAQIPARPYCIRADLDLCQGHGVCVNEAPDVFALDEEALKVRVVAERPGEAHRHSVESAVRHCPTRAIRLIEDD